MSKYGFDMLWSEEDEGFIATCPDFPGLSAFGESPEEALVEAKVALNLFIESLKESGDVLPKPTETVDYSGQIRLRMPKALHSSLAKKAVKEGMSLNSWLNHLLADKNAALGVLEEVISRFKNVEKAIHVHRAETREVLVKQSSIYTPEFNEDEIHGKAKLIYN